MATLPETAFRTAVIPGDGIGKAVTPQGLRGHAPDVE